VRGALRRPDVPSAQRSRSRSLVPAALLALLAGVAALAAAAAFDSPEPECDPCPQPAAARDELAVAGNAGSYLVAAWVRVAGGVATARVRVLDRDAAPARVPARVRGAEQRSCGRGCWSVTLAGRPRRLEVEVAERGRRYVARLPIRWRIGAGREARRLLARAERTMRALASVREHERITSGPGSLAVTRYALQAPDRMRYVVEGGGRVVIIGRTEWRRDADLVQWRRGRYGAGLPFRTRSWFRWSPYAESVQLLRRWSSSRGPRAEIAVYDPATPVWLRLLLDLRTDRVLRARMIAAGHFMTTRYFAFDRPVQIAAPVSRDG